MTTGFYTVNSTTGAVLADLGLPVGPVLHAAGMPEDLLLNPQVSLTPEQFYRCWYAAEAISGDSAFGVSLAAKLSAESFQAPIFAALCSPDLAHAARRLAKYKRLLGPQRLIVEADGAGLHVTTVMPPEPTPPTSLVAYELTFWVALARLGIRTRVVPARLTMPDPPDAEAYPEYLGQHIENGTSVTVTFTSLDARRPFLTASDAMWQVFDADLRRRLADLDRVETTTTRVRAALLELLPAGAATALQVSRRLAMSSRTLQRRLALEDTTFQAVLEDVRLSLARHYLAQPEVSIPEMALLLGYDEPSSFYRAFHRWSGTTPQRARTATA
ncbi:AraC family transcriptional regulator [Actinoplanes sp. NBRC 103695]|uniref:AraC family transcriptional regulator n=1 Tax=Actinoplanes sp. NBRC 103695 TaxID=3032202 RepID=UPI0024A3B4E0|nr:AraC family transcriptional regulator [Actinoplanes sp. NBRC 103695]GLZ02454.1 AraC family transcriptional regulator [Actinoplanes sp. NBRC 103695]